MFFPELSPQGPALLEQLRTGQVAVVGHLRPDGDCIGSQLALCRVLRHLGVEAIAVNQHAIPRILTPFVAETPFVTEADWQDTVAHAVFVDCADRYRAGEALALRFPRPLLCVDHHATNPGYALHNLNDPQASATAEILAGLFFDNDWPVDAATAQLLYVGMATDTGQFRFPSVTQRVFTLAARLLECGASPARASESLYENESLGKLRLLEQFLASLRLHCGQRACFGLLPAGTYERCGATIDDSEGLVDYARCLEGVEVGVLLEERGDVLKGSLRAKHSDARMDLLAQAFGGGGHACAAGFSIKGGSLASDYERIVQTLEKHLHDRLPMS